MLTYCSSCQFVLLYIIIGLPSAFDLCVAEYVVETVQPLLFLDNH